MSNNSSDNTAAEEERKAFYDLEHKSPAQSLLKAILLQMLDGLHDSPIHKHEVLLILVAMLDTDRVFRLKFAKTEAGRVGKALYEAARERFEVNGVVEASPVGEGES